MSALLLWNIFSLSAFAADRFLPYRHSCPSPLNVIADGFRNKPFFTASFFLLNREWFHRRVRRISAPEFRRSISFDPGKSSPGFSIVRNRDAISTCSSLRAPAFPGDYSVIGGASFGARGGWTRCEHRV